MFMLYESDSTTRMLVPFQASVALVSDPISSGEPVAAVRRSAPRRISRAVGTGVSRTGAPPADTALNPNWASIGSATGPSTIWPAPFIAQACVFESSTN
jgi:hypothetical protein